MEYYGQAGGGTFVNGTAINNVTRSKYGNRAVGNMTREMGQARNFVVPPGEGTAKMLALLSSD